MTSVEEILKIMAVFVVVLAILGYATGQIGNFKKQSGQLSERTGDIMKQTVDKVTAEAFLNELSFTYTLYKVSGGSPQIIESYSGSWDDLKAYVDKLSGEGKILPQIIYADTSDPVSSKKLPVKSKSVSFNLDPFKKITSPIPFGYDPMYKFLYTLQQSGGGTAYFVIGDASNPQYQLVVMTTVVKS